MFPEDANIRRDTVEAAAPNAAVYSSPPLRRQPSSDSSAGDTTGAAAATTTNNNASRTPPLSSNTSIGTRRGSEPVSLEMTGTSNATTATGPAGSPRDLPEAAASLRTNGFSDSSPSFASGRGLGPTPLRRVPSTIHASPIISTHCGPLPAMPPLVSSRNLFGNSGLMPGMPGMSDSITDRPAAQRRNVRAVPVTVLNTNTNTNATPSSATHMGQKQYSGLSSSATPPSNRNGGRGFGGFAYGGAGGGAIPTPFPFFTEPATGHGDTSDGVTPVFDARMQDQSIASNASPRLMALDDIRGGSSLGASESPWNRRQGVQPNGLTPIIDNVLYLGSHRDVCDVDALRRYNIRAFICVAGELSSPLPPFVTADDLDSGAVVFKHVKLSDGPTTQLRDHVLDVFDFIDEQARAGRRVALFCQQGKSRSASLAVAYLMREFGVDSTEAQKLLQSMYSRAEPNFFFLSQLQDITHHLPPLPVRRSSSPVPLLNLDDASIGSGATIAADSSTERDEGHDGEDGDTVGGVSAATAEPGELPSTATTARPPTFSNPSPGGAISPPLPQHDTQQPHGLPWETASPASLRRLQLQLQEPHWQWQHSRRSGGGSSDHPLAAPTPPPKPHQQLPSVPPTPSYLKDLLGPASPSSPVPPRTRHAERGAFLAT
jgi:hypothetical protein